MSNKPFKPLGYPLVDEEGLVRVCRRYTYKIYKINKSKKKKRDKNRKIVWIHKHKYTREKAVHILINQITHVAKISVCI